MTTQRHLYDEDDQLQIASPFSPDYVSQLRPARQIPFKVPELEDRPRFLHDTIAEEKEGKHFRLNKADI